jgi:hypothetical protein
MSEHEVRFTGWAHGPGSVPRAIFEVDEEGGTYTVAMSLREMVRAQLASEHQADDEDEEAFLDRLQEALRDVGEELAEEIAADPERSGSARREGHFTHEVAGHELERITERLSA